MAFEIIFFYFFANVDSALNLGFSCTVHCLGCPTFLCVSPHSAPTSASWHQTKREWSGSFQRRAGAWFNVWRFFYTCYPAGAVVEDCYGWIWLNRFGCHELCHIIRAFSLAFRGTWGSCKVKWNKSFNMKFILYLPKNVHQVDKPHNLSTLV